MLVVPRVVLRGFRSAVALAALPLALLLPARADALVRPASVSPLPLSLAHAQDSCGGQDTGVVCSEVVVPLDRSGVVPGTVTLHVEVVPSTGVNRGTMFLLAGGPGQGSAHVFGLGDASPAALYRHFFPGYT